MSTTALLKRRRPVVLAILDGWGAGRAYHGNAITMADTPYMDGWVKQYPHTTLVSHGQQVGLLSATTGNSEVGHINLGAGYIVPQDEVRINQSIADKTFFANLTLIEACGKAKKSAMHILALVGPGEVHSRIDHVWAALEMCRKQGVEQVHVHLFSDGRDAPPKWMGKNAEGVQAKIEQLGGTVASLCGRYYAMDRNNQWDRTALAYEMLVGRKGKVAATLAGAVKQSYEADKTDEFIEPTIIANGRAIKDGEVVLFMNFRTDRPRQLSWMLADKHFDQAKRSVFLPKLSLYTLTEYQKGLPVAGVVFPPLHVERPLARVVAEAGLKQLHIAETEKYAHVTFFINGGREEPFKGEDRVLIPSPEVATYDLQPAMSAVEVTDRLVKEIEGQRYDLIVVNYANTDMVGHSGDLQATIEAAEVVDTCLGRVAKAVLAEDGVLLVTSDHGNAEVMLTPTNDIDTQHHANKVPLVAVGHDLPGTLKPGVLANVTPTILDLLGLDHPTAMTCDSLWEKS